MTTSTRSRVSRITALFATGLMTVGLVACTAENTEAQAFDLFGNFSSLSSSSSSVTPPITNPSPDIPDTGVEDELPSYFEYGTDVRVIDGDTVEVEIDGERQSVRFIGVDTPETVHPNRDPEPFGAEAADLNRDLINLSGTTDVWLEFDESQGRTDIYDRLLAYVWTVDAETGQPKEMLNLMQLEAGFGEEYTFDADYRHLDQFLQTQGRAQDAGRGIWG